MKKPLIGITGNFGDKGCELAKGYYQSVLRAGGAPVIIPPYVDDELLGETLSRLDGIVLSGGGDLNPMLVGEDPVPGLHGINGERDEAELNLIREAARRQIPMLGICRGIQMLVAALGGNLYQDLDSQYADAPLIKHSQDLAREKESHWVTLEKDSLLSTLFGGSERLAVNSFHHQAVKNPGSDFRVTARSSDGVIEAVESAAFKSIMGVQWHPECLDSHLPIFLWLVDEARNYMEAKAFHDRHLSLDSHCDTPMVGVWEFPRRSEKSLVDVVKMQEGHLDASIMVAYLPQGERSDAGHAEARRKAEGILDDIRAMVTVNADKVGIAATPDELYALKAQGRKAIMLGIENGYAIGRDLSLLQHFREKGIVYMTLCHNGNNEICQSARPKPGDEGEGVTDFGREVIREMNRLGIMVDMSHASEKSFYDALELSDKPIVCSHSSSRALCDHPRDLTDEQLRALAQKGGVAQVTFYDGFLRKEGGATIDDAVAHLKHMVEVAGIEHVGIGTDFDGDGGVPGLASASELINFTRRLLREGFTEKELCLLWGENFLRVMRQVQG